MYFPVPTSTTASVIVILVGILLESVKVSVALARAAPHPGRQAASPDEYTGRVLERVKRTSTAAKITITKRTSLPLTDYYELPLGYIEAYVDMALRRNDKRQLQQLRDTLVYLGELRQPGSAGNDDGDPEPVLREWYKERKYNRQFEEIDRRNKLQLNNSWKSSRFRYKYGFGFLFLCSAVLCIITVVRCRYSKRSKPVEGATMRVARLGPGPTRQCPSSVGTGILTTTVEEGGYLPSAPLVSSRVPSPSAPPIHLLDVPPPYEEAVRSSAIPFSVQSPCIESMEEEPPPFNPEFEKFDPSASPSQV